GLLRHAHPQPLQESEGLFPSHRREGKDHAAWLDASAAAIAQVVTQQPLGRVRLVDSLRNEVTAALQSLCQHARRLAALLRVALGDDDCADAETVAMLR